MSPYFVFADPVGSSGLDTERKKDKVCITIYEYKYIYIALLA